MTMKPHTYRIQQICVCYHRVTKFRCFGRTAVAKYILVGFSVGVMASYLMPNSVFSRTADVDVLDQMNDHSPLEEYHRNEDLEARELARRVRVLCFVITSPKYHKKRARHVKATWGKRCNTLLFISSAAEPSLPTVTFDIEDTYDNLLKKVIEAFKYVHKHYSEDYDWVLKADDDTYVIVENLRYFLYEYNTSEPLYFGCRYRKGPIQGYMSGGAGYVLSREAMNRLIYRALLDNQCKKKYKQEDGEIGRCLEQVGVKAMDTRDRYQRGRFFPFNLEPILANKVPNWYHSYTYYNSTDTIGMACCSDVAISFHYITGAQMYVMDYMLYHVRPYGIYHPDTLNLLVNASQHKETVEQNSN